MHNKTEKPVLRLYDSVGTGIIIAYPSGVRVSNQIGGTACLQPEMEGVFIPVRNDCLLDGRVIESPEFALSQHFTGPKHRGAGALSGIDIEDADYIDGVLRAARLDRAILVDRSRLHESHEAWIHVVVSSDDDVDPDMGAFSGFHPYPRLGILTWCNSD